MEAGLPDRLQSSDFRQGNLKVLDIHYRTSVRNRGARHRPGTNVYETSYVCQKMNAISQDAFLGRGVHSPLLDVLNRIGLHYDENAPMKVPDEMMHLVGSDNDILQLEEKLSTLRLGLQERYGKASWATGADKTNYDALQNQLKVARQRHSRKVLDTLRKDHFLTKNNEELSRQLSCESHGRPQVLDGPIKSVYFVVPKRRHLAALLSDFNEPSKDNILYKRINTVIALIQYAWIVKREDQALLQDPPEEKAEDDHGPHKRPLFASMIRVPVNFPRYAEPKCEESSTPALSLHPPIKESLSVYSVGRFHNGEQQCRPVSTSMLSGSRLRPAPYLVLAQNAR